MKLQISRRPARAAALAAIAARVFMGLMIESPGRMGGAWVSALAGGLLALPWLLCLDRLPREGRRPLYPLMLGLSLFDAATALSAVARSSGYLALDRVPPVWLALPALAAGLWCVHRNGDAIGYGAMIWARLFPALLAIVALLQARHYRPEWLRPILGQGWQTALNGGIRCAGWIASASSVLLVSEGPRPEKRGGLWGMLALGVAIPALLIVLRLMMTPTTLRDGWIIRLDSLLTNGRAPLYLQLPLIVLWYAGLLHLFACEGFAAAALLQGLVPRLDGNLCGAIAIACVGLISRAGLPDGEIVDMLSQWAFIVVASATAFAAILSVKRKGGAEPCASEG